MANYNSASLQTPYDGWSCISGFNDFLYQMVKINRNDERFTSSIIDPSSAIYPSSPWELSAEIPRTMLNHNSDNGIIRTNIELARTHSEQTELWIRYGKNVIKHNTTTGDFALISTSPYKENGEIYDGVLVQDLFEAINGEILGVNYPESYSTVWKEAIPLFSIYNEDKNKFEFYDIGIKFRETQIRDGHIGLISRDGVIISKSSSLIWIYQQQNGLYSYNILNSELQHYKTSFSGIVDRMVSSNKGFLLFSQEKEDELIASLKLSPGELVKFFPSTQTYEEIEVPFFRWADYGTLLYTNSGDLWIGIHGYLSNDGNWVLKNPNKFAYINLGSDSDTYNWVHPELLFQSSNNYLWYTNYTGDGVGVNGSAWYDPASETGCWFTTESGNIVEDSKKNIWMAINGKIYKYSISK
jgi:hypothetical protein